MGGQTKCLHGLAIGECPAPGCPIWLGAPDGRLPWSTGWALSTYSGVARHDTRVGDLVYLAKYSTLSTVHKMKLADELADRMLAFIYDVYEKPTLPFHACLAPPSHGSSQFQLASVLCERICDDLEIENVTHFIGERHRVPSMKTLQGFDARLKALQDALDVRAASLDAPHRTFLVIDDVYETGASAQAVCRVLGDNFRGSTFHLMYAARRS